MENTLKVGDRIAVNKFATFFSEIKRGEVVVFKDPDNRALTQRINQTDVKPTLAWLEEMLPGLDLQNNTLGSTGVKDTSGDLDLAIDAKQLTQEQVDAVNDIIQR